MGLEDLFGPSPGPAWWRLEKDEEKEEEEDEDEEEKDEDRG